MTQAFDDEPMPTMTGTNTVTLESARVGGWFNERQATHRGQYGEWVHGEWINGDIDAGYDVQPATQVFMEQYCDVEDVDEEEDGLDHD